MAININTGCTPPVIVYGVIGFNVEGNPVSYNVKLGSIRPNNDGPNGEAMLEFTTLDDQAKSCLASAITVWDFVATC